MRRTTSVRERIVDRATQLISVRGLQGMTLDELVIGADSSKGALFHHFEGKKSVALAAIERAEAMWWSVVFAPSSASADPWGRLCTMLDRLWDVAAHEIWEGGCFFLALGTEVDDQDTDLAAAVRGFFERWQTAIEDIVASGVAGGQFKPGIDARRIGRLVMATGEGGVLLSRLWNDPAVYRDVLGQLRNLLADSLLAEPMRGRG